MIAGDIGLRIKIPSLEIYCSDTKRFEDFNLVMDKEIDERVEYLKRE